MSETDTESCTEYQEYRKYTGRKILFVLVCLAVALFTLGYSLSIGNMEIPFFRVYEIVYNHIIGHTEIPNSLEWVQDSVVWEFRLPKAVFALLAGASLAVAGVAMQGVMNNPLADPYTTGISSGACFGVSVAMILGFTIMSNTSSNIAIVVNSFLFSLIPMMMIIAIAPKTRSSPATLILAGVAISYMFNAMNTIMMVSTEEETLAEVYKWQVGSINELSWDDVPVVLITSFIGIAIISLLSRQLNVLSMGENSAKSLGVNVDRLRIILLVVMAFMVAAVISFAGIIGFIGLVSPHMIRMMIDSDNRFVIPASALFSATLLLACDLIGRIVSPNGEIPVGVIISLVGAPIFLYLMVRRNSSVW